MQMTSPSSPFSPLARGVCCAHGQSTSPDECLIEKQQFQREGERFMRGSANIRDVSNLQCSGGPAIDRAPGCNVGSAVGAPPSLCPSCVLASSPSLLPSRPPPSRLCRSTSRLLSSPPWGEGRRRHRVSHAPWLLAPPRGRRSRSAFLPPPFLQDASSSILFHGQP